MNITTGGAISGEAHLRQSIVDIITTPLGSRVMRREYGCGLFDLLDAGQTEPVRVAMIAAINEALARWEPRLAVELIRVQWDEGGHVVVDLQGRYLPGGNLITLEGLLVQ